MTGIVPRWLRVHRDYPRAAGLDRAWCRADGEGSPTYRWLLRSAAHRVHLASLHRRGVYDTRWTVMR